MIRMQPADRAAAAIRVIFVSRVLPKRDCPTRWNTPVRIAEIFQSIQGEGQFTGTPSVFVRTSGCNLRCWFCDTPYTSWQPEGVQRSWQSVADEVLAIDCEHVVITGGEPLLQRDIIPLTAALTARGRFITIETAGTVYRPVRAQLMSISPKLTNSIPSSDRSVKWKVRHEQTRHSPNVIAQLIGGYAYQLKFVVDRPEDVNEIEIYLWDFPTVPASRVWLMPQAITREALIEKSTWIAQEAKHRGYNFSSRLHIELFGNTRGT